MPTPNSRDRSPRPTRTPAARESSAGLLRFVVVLVVLAWVLRSFIAAPFSIPSGSMLPTLYIGDYLIVAKWPYGYSRYSFPLGLPSFAGRISSHLPARGEVVVFRHPGQNIDLIKRVVGLPGDTVAVDHGRLILNGRPVPTRPLAPSRLPVSANSPCRSGGSTAPNEIIVNGAAYCVYPAFEETLPGGPSYTVLDQVSDGPADNFGPVAVPSGHLFVMGDNRDDSLDSRFGPEQGGVGMVPTANLIGRAMVTFWSTDGSASYARPWTWFRALRSSRVGNGYSDEAQ
ncbi:MAG: signal peptidase I [Sphingomicrobium sp.]